MFSGKGKIVHLFLTLRLRLRLLLLSSASLSSRRDSLPFSLSASLTRRPSPHPALAKSPPLLSTRVREKLSTPATAISALPDDLLLECLSRLPTSSLPSLPLVSSRFNRLLSSDSLPFLRRSLGLLNHSFIAVSLSSDLTLLSFYTLPFHPSSSNQSG